MKTAVAFVCGIVFAVGLAFSGMLQPAKVLGFLDVFGRWDPALAFVMGPAVGVYLAVWRWRRGRASPCGSTVPAESIHTLDLRLILGASLFGAGWGLCGICPGPALVNLVAPNGYFLAFFAALLGGVALSFAVPKTTGGLKR